MKNVKKALFSFTCISLITFCFTSCVEKGGKEEKENTPVVIAPTQIVEIGQAKTMYDAYGKRRVPLIQRYEDSINRSKDYYKTKQQKMQQNQKDGETQIPKPFDVARYIHYDYDTIKQYMAYIEQEAKAANVEISTLRIYFSNYPDQKYFPESKDPIKHPRQSSVMLSPTLKKENRDYLFYIDDTMPEGPKAVLLDDEFSPTRNNKVGNTTTKNKKTYASFLPVLTKPKPNAALLPYQGPTSLTMNRGHGSPPN